MAEGTPDTNISTEHQQDGDARRPSDTLDREQTDTAAQDNDGERRAARSVKPDPTGA